MNTKAVINYPLITTDSKGNVVHSKDSNGYECWREYDSNNNCIYYKDSNGYEFWREYDSNNNYIYSKDFNGYECWYDSEGKLITYPNIIKEVTLDEIASLLKVDVKNLKIKKI
jgi:hypothetical protein